MPPGTRAACPTATGHLTQEQRQAYRILGAEPSDTDAQVRLAYLQAVRAAHPDRAGPSGEAATRELNRARAVVAAHRQSQAARQAPACPTSVLPAAGLRAVQAAAAAETRAADQAARAARFHKAAWQVGLVLMAVSLLALLATG